MVPLNILKIFKGFLSLYSKAVLGVLNLGGGMFDLSILIYPDSILHHQTNIGYWSLMVSSFCHPWVNIFGQM